MYNLILRTQELVRDPESYYNLTVKEGEAVLNPIETAVVIVDMWNRHWCTGATERAGKLAPRINEFARNARAAGSLIVHAPSDTVEFYKDTDAYKRAAIFPVLSDIKDVRKIEDYPQPVDSSDGGSDTIDDHAPNTRVWQRQNKDIYIDDCVDIISDNGDIIYSYMVDKKIKNIIYTGVHTNMCILGRSFAIKAMLRRGMNTILARDLTDAMYNPAKPPYVSHEEGTKLIIEYIEKFYCPTISINSSPIFGI